MIDWIWGVIWDGDFWLGIIPGCFLGAWLVMRGDDYQKFQAAENKKMHDAPIKFFE